MKEEPAVKMEKEPWEVSKQISRGLYVIFRDLYTYRLGVLV